MKTFRLKGFLGMFVVTSLMLVAACDGDDDGDGTPVTGDTTPTATEGGETPTATPDGSGEGTPSPQQTAEVAGQYGLAPAGSPEPGPTEAAAGEDSQQLALQANIGQEAPQDLIDEWNIDITPDGDGLPDGEGSVSDGADVFTANCARCHGEEGEGTPLAPLLVLDEGGPGPWEYGAPRTVANYWPYLTTYMDYINRAMPFDQPDTLSDDELYAVVAWILNQNEMLEDDATLDRDSVIEMNELPNLPSFFPCFPDDCRPEPELQGGGGGGG